MLGNRGYSDATPTQHRLECHRVLTLACESRKLPDEDLLERRIRALRLIEHLAELRSVGDAAGLGLVDVLPRDDVAVALSEVAQGAELGGDGEVDVLTVRRDSGI